MFTAKPRPSLSARSAAALGFIAGVLFGVALMPEERCPAQAPKCITATIPESVASLKNALVVFPILQPFAFEEASTASKLVFLSASLVPNEALPRVTFPENTAAEVPLLDVWYVIVAHALLSLRRCPMHGALRSKSILPAPSSTLVPFPYGVSPVPGPAIASVLFKLLLISLLLASAAASVLLTVLLRRGLRVVDSVVSPASTIGSVVVSAGSVMVAPVTAATKSTCYLATAALCSTHAGLSLLQSASEAARLGAASTLFASRCAKETFSFLTTPAGVGNPVPPSLHIVATQGAALLRDEQVAALIGTMRRRGCDLAEAVCTPWHAACKAASSLLVRAPPRRTPSQQAAPEPLFRIVPRRSDQPTRLLHEE